MTRIIITTYSLEIITTYSLAQTTAHAFPHYYIRSLKESIGLKEALSVKGKLVKTKNYDTGGYIRCLNHFSYAQVIFSTHYMD